LIDDCMTTGDSPIYRWQRIDTHQAFIKPESPFSVQERWRPYSPHRHEMWKHFHRNCHEPSQSRVPEAAIAIICTLGLTSFAERPSICVNGYAVPTCGADHLALPHRRETRWRRHGCRLQGRGHGAWS